MIRAALILATVLPLAFVGWLTLKAVEVTATVLDRLTERVHDGPSHKG